MMLATNKVLARSELCRDCQACTLACSLLHEGACSPSLARLRVDKDMARYAFRISICRHCDTPECVTACPVDAISIDDRGVAILDDEACIRCGSCADACPYDAIFYDEARDRYFKCDLCAEREDGPLCVAVCPVGALTFDDDAGGEV